MGDRVKVGEVVMTGTGKVLVARKSLKLHPLDSEKYGKAHRYLVDTVGNDEGSFYAPDPA